MARLDGDILPARRSSLAAPLFRDRAALETPALYERAGPFEICLVTSAKDLQQTQRLRYQVFYEEGRAVANAAATAARRDICPFDEICDHLIVRDVEALVDGRRKPRIVGTYRLLRRDVAERHNGFYSQGEFDLAPMLARNPTARLLELGRSCVHAQYRSKRVIELLWRGLYLYAQMHRVEALVGCASLPGTDPEALRLPLSLLLSSMQADADWQVSAWAHCKADFAPCEMAGGDLRRGLLMLPPLIKAYMRTGAKFGRDAVIDRQFGTTDVFAVMPMADIEDRYLSHYGEPSCLSEAPVA